MPVMMISAVTTDDEPDFISLRNENSSPMLNISTTIPRSAQNVMLSRLEIEGRYSNFGDAKKPARIYPNTTGCFSFLNSSVTSAPNNRIHARSAIRPLVCDSSAVGLSPGSMVCSRVCISLVTVVDGTSLYPSAIGRYIIPSLNYVQVVI